MFTCIFFFWTIACSKPGVKYYYNPQTGDSTWDKPPGFQAPAESDKWVETADLETGMRSSVGLTVVRSWRRHRPSFGRPGKTYYYNPKTHQTSWVKPAAPAPPPGNAAAAAAAGGAKLLARQSQPYATFVTVLLA